MEFLNKIAPLILFYIMFSLGLHCKFSDFKKVLVNPKNLIIGLLSQTVVLPIIGLVFAYFAPISLNYKVGIILITCVPSTVTSNYLTKIINGNISLSITMTAISSLISFITIPLIITKIAPIIGLMNAVKIDLNFLKLSFVLFVISTVPIVLGILTNTKFNNFSQSVSPLINKSAILLFIITILVAWYSDFEMSLIAYKEMFLVLIVLMLLVLIYVNILVKALKINVRDSKTIITETFIQNGAMGILIGSSIFGLGSGYLMMSAIYGLFQYKLFLVWYLIDKKINKVV